MAALIIFLTLYAVVTVGFLIALVRWTIRSERRCACGGSMGSGFAMIHGTQSCYPAAEGSRAI